MIYIKKKNFDISKIHIDLRSSRYKFRILRLNPHRLMYTFYNDEVSLNTGNSVVLFILRESLPWLLKFSLFILSLIKKKKKYSILYSSIAYIFWHPTTLIPRNWRNIRSIRYTLYTIYNSIILLSTIYTYSHMYKNTYTRSVFNVF